MKKYFTKIIFYGFFGIISVTSFAISAKEKNGSSGTEYPAADFTMSVEQPLVNQKIKFDAQKSKDPDGKIVDYKWDFGDGNTGNGKKIDHSYKSKGVYPIKLDIIDNDGNLSSCTKTLQVFTGDPISDFTYMPRIPNLIDSVSFDASESFDVDGEILEYHWDFGGKQIKQGEKVKHLFDQSKQYSVILKVVDNNGNVGVSKKVIDVVDDLGHPNNKGSARMSDKWYEALQTLLGKPPISKPRVIVTTDGEIDDRSSFVRYLLYTNDFNTEGIIATNSKWQKHGHGTGWIFKQIEAYDKIRPNLIEHDPGYPMASELRSKVFLGNQDVNKLHTVGPENDTEGSNHIIKILLQDNPRPVWTLGWGGTNTIAQALWRLKESYTIDEYLEAVSKIRIYAVSFQDDTGEWIKNNVPEALLILDFQFATINYEHEGHPYSNHKIFDPAWITENIKTNHGALGELYPQKYQSEGDSPSFFHLMDTGLHGEVSPDYGGWGGRHKNESANFWVDAEDDGDRKKPIWRFLPDISNDFASRMDWCVKPFTEANHAPLFNSDIIEMDVKVGDIIELNAGGVSDPDGDKLTYKWWHYKEAGSTPFETQINILNSKTDAAKITVPEATGKKLHIILEVTDDGEPLLKSYRRYILIVK